jgi:nucleoid-associated protein YgaU
VGRSEGLGEGNVFKPQVPAARAFDVATANKYGLPMTRADLTGDIGAARVEGALSRSITGGPMFQRLYQEKLAAIEKAKSQIGSRFGTDQPLSSSGLEAKLSMQEQMSAAQKTAGRLYKEIPDPQIQVGKAREGDQRY